MNVDRIQPILQDTSFSISAGERIGLIGPNDCGKTTLMRILVGEEKPDEGTVANTRPNLLDIPSRARFEQALTQFNGNILAVVHDRYFIEPFASDVWTVRNGKVEKW